MYTPEYFQITDSKVIRDFIDHHGFATLIAPVAGRLIASHIPLMADRDDQKLYGHIARCNALSEAMDGETQLLAIFMNTHAYISSSWYEHANVPTWNYTAVHIYGTAEIIEGRELSKRINQLVEKYEKNRPNRFYMKDMNEEMLSAHMKGLVGFSMKIERTEAAFKLSQNRSKHDYYQIIKKLEEQGDPFSAGIAEEMKKIGK